MIRQTEILIGFVLVPTRNMLADGASVSIYVFFGGTNFGFGAGNLCE